MGSKRLATEDCSIQEYSYRRTVEQNYEDSYERCEEYEDSYEAYEDIAPSYKYFIRNGECCLA